MCFVNIILQSPRDFLVYVSVAVESEKEHEKTFFQNEKGKKIKKKKKLVKKYESLKSHLLELGTVK